MKPNKIRWGIIGCGNVTEVKSGPAFQKTENSELVAVMRRTGHLAQDYARRHNITRWYDNADKLINDPDVDAVYIATPPDSHMEYTIKAAEAGKPVYVEKPMAQNFSECQRTIEACSAANVPLYVAYYRRAQPRFLKVKELLENNAIGDVRLVRTHQTQPLPKDLDAGSDIPWRLQPQLSGGGLFFDLASHTLDILDFLLGPVVSVRGTASNQGRSYKAEDIVTGIYSFEAGVQGIGSWCFSAFEDSDMNEIIGSKGRISFSTFGNDPITLTTDAGIEEWSFKPLPHMHGPLVETIVGELTGKAVQCPSTAQSAARINWVMGEMVK